MDAVVNIIPLIYIIGFTHRSNGNSIRDILTVDLRCDSSGYIFFEEIKVLEYFWWLPNL